MDAKGILRKHKQICLHDSQKFGLRVRVAFLWEPGVILGMTLGSCRMQGEEASHCNARVSQNYFLFLIPWSERHDSTLQKEQEGVVFLAGKGTLPNSQLWVSKVFWQKKNCEQVVQKVRQRHTENSHLFFLRRMQSR